MKVLYLVQCFYCLKSLSTEKILSLVKNSSFLSFFIEIVFEKRLKSLVNQIYNRKKAAFFNDFNTFISILYAFIDFD